MKYSLPTFYLLLQCSYALYVLPAPLNVSVDSHNFHHNLRWVPGPETPRGTTYKMCRLQGERCKPVKNPLKLDPFSTHILCVWAVYNQTESKKAQTVFTPFTDTVISSPNFTLTGCGNCTGLELEISPQPLPDKGHYFKNKTIQDLYGGHYSVLWKKAGDTKIINDAKISELKLELKDLEPGVKYCVQVRLVTNSNPKTLSSEWACAYTSVRQNQVPAILLGVSALIILASVTLLVLGFGLVYTGFLWMLKAHLPRALLVSHHLQPHPTRSATLVHYYILTPERTIPDLVSIDSQPQELVKGVRTKPDPDRINPDLTTSDEEEEEEDNGNHGYMDRPVGLRSDSNSGRESQDASGGEGVPLPDVARDSGGLSTEVEAEEGEVSVGGAVLRSFTETEVKDYSVKASICLEDLATIAQHEMGGGGEGGRHIRGAGNAGKRQSVLRDSGENSDR
ncbi:cytokine receptor family member b1 isoform X2 [Osmerus mordax]|uniref:cytokine receptor family member b1 isoform X2 n=1 Tax=Osmerus mordax TaxID=8014 RepID=UPI0035105E50